MKISPQLDLFLLGSLGGDGGDLLLPQLEEQLKEQLDEQLAELLEEQLKEQLDDEDVLQKRRVFSRGIDGEIGTILYLTHALVMLRGRITENQFSTRLVPARRSARRSA